MEKLEENANLSPKSWVLCEKLDLTPPGICDS